MDQETVLKNFFPGKTFTKSQFRKAVHALNPEYAESSINWLLEKLKKENQIIAVGQGKYERMSDMAEKNQYGYTHSKEYRDIERKITKEYPLVEFQMWELIQFNEFVNHQIAKNLIVVEVENMLEETVFDTLHREYPYVLYSPQMEYYYRHKGEENTVVVLKLISEAPKPREGHSSRLEKLLVDLFTSKFTGYLIEKSEYHGRRLPQILSGYDQDVPLCKAAQCRNKDESIYPSGNECTTDARRIKETRC